MSTALSSRIDWKFIAAFGVSAARYGVFKDKFYKQVLVAGLPNDDLYPPREIQQNVYDASFRLASAMKKIDFTRT